MMVIHPLLQSRLREALAQIGELEFVRSPPRAISVIDEEFVVSAAGSRQAPLGLIERYRERLPFAPGDPVVTLGEGSTPLVPRRCSPSGSAPRSTSSSRGPTRPAPSRTAA